MFYKVILPSNAIHILSGSPKTFEELCNIIQSKFHDNLPKYYSLRYKDSDDEIVLLTCDEDLETAINVAEAEKLKNIRIMIREETSDKYLKNRELCDESRAAEIESNPGFVGSELNQIPLTESLTDLPSKDGENSENNKDRKSTCVEGGNRGWGDFTGVKETTSQFCSPVVNLSSTNKNRFSFNRRDSLEAELLKENIFNKDQIENITQIIEQTVGKCLGEKLDNILAEIAGDFPSRFNTNVKRHYPPFPMCSVVSPFGMRLSSKRCKELVCNDKTTCCECKANIKEVRYSCLTCKNYDCCEACEEKVEHQHPLLKIKQNRTSNQNVSDLPMPALMPTLSRGMSRSSVNHTFNRHAHEESTTPLQNNNSTLGLSKSPDTNRTRGPDSIKTSKSPESKLGTTAGQDNAEHPQLETCDVSSLRRYKVTVVKEPIYDVIRVKQRCNYTVDWTVKNTGAEKWPNHVCLICTQGIHKGTEKEIDSLVPGQEFAIHLELEAPNECGRYLSQWKLHYYENDIFKSFGKVLYVEIDVGQAPKDSFTDNGSGKKAFGAGGKKGVDLGQNLTPKEQEMMRETGCSFEAFNQAKTLNEMFPGDLKEKVEFVKDYPSTLNINDLVSAFLDRLSSSCKRRVSTSTNNNMQKSNQLYL